MHYASFINLLLVQVSRGKAADYRTILRKYVVKLRLSAERSHERATMPFLLSHFSPGDKIEDCAAQFLAVCWIVRVEFKVHRLRDCATAEANRSSYRDCTKSDRSTGTQQTRSTISRYSLECQLATVYALTAGIRAIAVRSLRVR